MDQNNKDQIKNLKTDKTDLKQTAQRSAGEQTSQPKQNAQRSAGQRPTQQRQRTQRPQGQQQSAQRASGQQKAQSNQKAQRPQGQQQTAQRTAGQQNAQGNQRAQRPQGQQQTAQRTASQQTAQRAAGQQKAQPKQTTEAGKTAQQNQTTQARQKVQPEQTATAAQQRVQEAQKPVLPEDDIVIEDLDLNDTSYDQAPSDQSATDANDKGGKSISGGKLAIYIIAIIIVACGIGYLVYHFVSQAQRKASYDDIKPTVVTQEETTTEKKADYTSPIDFATLQAINDDIYSWIEITGTDISYPVLQSKEGVDDSFYLNVTYDMVEGFPGSIYTHKDNSKDYTDHNTVIYGHELADNTMFTQLHNYADLNYFNEHREIKIYLPDKEITYKVFAAVTYNDNLITYYYNSKSPEEVQSFLDSVYNNGYLGDVIADDIHPTGEDYIITLSTCIYSMPSNRYLVLAVKTGEIPEQ